MQRRVLVANIFNHVIASIGKGLIVFCLLHLIFTHGRDATLTFSHWHSMPVFVLICWALGELANVIAWAIAKID